MIISALDVIPVSSLSALNFKILFQFYFLLTVYYKKIIHLTQTLGVPLLAEIIPSNLMQVVLP
jgi:hypothetical protein